MKGNNWSHKVRFGGYLKLICICLLEDIYTELTRKIISFEMIIYVYGKTYMIVLIKLKQALDYS